MPQTERTTPCKICGAESQLCGVVDFEKICSKSPVAQRQLSGVPVYYHRCAGCGLVFTRAFDGWNHDDFMDRIYNDEYSAVDPDYAESRPAENAEFMIGALKDGVNDAMHRLRILDYGGGNGKFAQIMNSRGVNCQSWDPLIDASGRPSSRAFDIVTAFEVFEHSPNPLESIAEAISFMMPGGMLIFSTLMIPAGITNPCDIWYVAPRNGHVTIFTEPALGHVARILRLEITHHNQVLHNARLLSQS